GFGACRRPGRKVPDGTAMNDHLPRGTRPTLRSPEPHGTSCGICRGPTEFLEVFMADASSLNPSREDFAALLEESFTSSGIAEGSVVKGKVVQLENDFVIIDVGL